MDTPAKQQAAERLKQANNVLVTVSTDPSVDQLAACIGLTLMLNRMGKHATAVFSGKVPSTIEFLQPERTLETNTDSLRDFIISLDKSKADKLRYKVEDQVVKIFITPYRTSISEKDLVFSQGDFNVEVVIALGVQTRTQLDAAITAHGRILHDATVISMSAGGSKPSDIGQINWQDPAASSLSEMVVGMSEALGTGLIDNQMATAFLTGIVAETDRFSNNKTSPRVMTMSAQLMAAGANQQLIVQKLNPPPPPPPPPVKAPPPAKKAPPPPQAPKVTKPAPPPKKEDKNTLSVSHEPTKADGPEVQIDPNEIHIDEQGNLKTAAELQAEIDRLQKLKEQKEKESPPPPPEEKASGPIPIHEPPTVVEPPLPPPPPPIPQALPALPTIEQATFVPSKPVGQAVPPQKHSHHVLMNPADGKPVMSSPFTANTTDETKPVWANETSPVDPLNNPTQGNHDDIFDHSRVVQPPQSTTPQASPSWTPPPVTPQTPISVDSARSAVENALSSQPFDPAHPSPIASLGAQPMGPELHSPTIGVPPVSEPAPSLSLPQNGNNMPPPPPAPPPLPPIPPTR